jgi:hypothetical protein
MRILIDLPRRSMNPADGEPQTMPYGTGVLLNDLYGNKLYLTKTRAERVG